MGNRRFDAVLCIGVIEYANKFFRAKDGFDRMLARMGELLAENGVLVIAIENRLGLKYFAGAPEDHTNQPYEGIEDLYQPGSVLTLGRGEWLRRLDEQGLEPAHWFYPWPDYKTPELIVSEAAFQEPSLDLSTWIRRHAHGRQDEPGTHRFSETLAWPVLARNGLAGELANSFLLVARRKGSGVDVKPSALLWEFETERQRAHATVTQITKCGPDLRLVRTSLYPQATVLPTQHKLEASTRSLDMRSLDDELFEALNRPGWTIAQIAERAAPWTESFQSELQLLSSALQSVRSCAEPAGDVPLRLVELVPLLIKQLGLPAQGSGPQALTNETLIVRKQNRSTKTESTFSSQLFWKTSSTGYSEASSRIAKGHLESARQTVSVGLPHLATGPIGELRFDMSDRPGIARLHGLSLKAQDGEVLWNWDGSAKSLQSARRVDASFASHRGAVVMKLFSRDPNVILPIPSQILESLTNGATLEMDLEWMDPMSYLRDLEQM